MAGRKLSAKTEEEIVFLERLLQQCNHLTAKVEEYAVSKKGAEGMVAMIARQLGQLRQQAMMKNLGPVADQAGLLSVAAGRGSQPQRARTLREGLVQFKQMVERTMKATIEADERQREEAKKVEAERAAAARMAERALRESLPAQPAIAELTASVAAPEQTSAPAPSQPTAAPTPGKATS